MAERTRFVALGDSLSEGWCDPVADSGEPWFGWADRLAILLDRAAADDGGAVDYANLAVRGRRVDAIANEQAPNAVAIRPHLVSVMGGGNDLLLPNADPIRIARRLDSAVARIRDGGATVLLATGVDPILPAIARGLRGRFERFADEIRCVAEHRGAVLLDLWELDSLREAGSWAPDRIHLTPAGHRRLAAEAARSLGVPGHAAPTDPLGAAPAVSHECADALGFLAWARTHAAPWIVRRIRGVSSGDGVTAKLPEPVPVRGWWQAEEVSAPSAANRLSHHGLRT